MVSTGLNTPPSHTLSVYTVYIDTGGGGVRVESKRKLEGQQFTKLYIQSINSEKHLPQTPFTGQFFR
jgi:hypothetical protein